MDSHCCTILIVSVRYITILRGVGYELVRTYFSKPVKGTIGYDVRLGPILSNFLIPSSTPLSYNFQQYLPNAQIMAYKATHDPCPIGILRTADAIWKQNKTRIFYEFVHGTETIDLHNPTAWTRDHQRILHPPSQCNED